MQYRKLGKTGIEVSAVGMGTVRLPVINGNASNIDIEKSTKVIRHAIDKGINYIDTAYPYHGGTAEAALKIALDDGYRDKVYIGDKLPVWLCETYEECEKFFNRQLEQVGVEFFDLYFLHSLNKDYWEKAKRLGVLDLLEKLKANGKIKHIGFSFHDKYEVFEEILNAYPWEFCLIQLNYMDMGYQAGEKGLRLAADKGMGVFIMEPLKGGLLMKKPPKNVEEIWRKSGCEISLAERGISFLLNRHEVSCVLSGMNEIEQVDENTKIADKYMPGHKDDFELSIYKEAKDELSRFIKIPCTGCNYCMPCPMGVDIPANIDTYNIGYMYDDIEKTKSFFNRKIFDNRRSTLCIGCGVCASKCPQGLDIPDIMRMISNEWAF